MEGGHPVSSSITSSSPGIRVSTCECAFVEVRRGGPRTPLRLHLPLLCKPHPHHSHPRSRPRRQLLHRRRSVQVHSRSSDLICDFGTSRTLPGTQSLLPECCSRVVLRTTLPGGFAVSPIAETQTLATRSQYSTDATQGPGHVLFTLLAQFPQKPPPTQAARLGGWLKAQLVGPHLSPCRGPHWALRNSSWIAVSRQGGGVTPPVFSANSA